MIEFSPFLRDDKQAHTHGKMIERCFLFPLFFWKHFHLFPVLQFLPSINTNVGHSNSFHTKERFPFDNEIHRHEKASAVLFFCVKTFTELLSLLLRTTEIPLRCLEGSKWVRRCEQWEAFCHFYWYIQTVVVFILTIFAFHYFHIKDDIYKRKTFQLFSVFLLLWSRLIAKDTAQEELFA